MRLEAQSLVEGIRRSLSRLGLRRRVASIARINGSLRSLELSLKLLADEVTDNLDVQGRAVGELSGVSGLERVFLASIKAGTEDDGRVRSGAEIELAGTGGGSWGSGWGSSSGGITGYGSGWGRAGSGSSGVSSDGGNVSTGSSCGSGTGRANGGGDISSADIGLEEVQADDAACLVVRIVTGVALGGRVVDIAGCERAGGDGIVRVAANGVDLLRNLEGDGLVGSRGAGRSWVLVLGDGGDFWVCGLDRGASDGCETDLACVALESTVLERGGHASDIFGSFGVGECLVGGGLLETVGVGDGPLACCGGGVAEKAEDGVLDVVRVVELEVRVYDVENGLVGVLLGHFTAVKAGVGVDGAGRCGGKEERDGDDDLGLHFDCSWTVKS